MKINGDLMQYHYQCNVQSLPTDKKYEILSKIYSEICKRVVVTVKIYKNI